MSERELPWKFAYASPYCSSSQSLCVLLLLPVRALYEALGLMQRGMGEYILQFIINPKMTTKQEGEVVGGVEPTIKQCTVISVAEIMVPTS